MPLDTHAAEQVLLPTLKTQLAPAEIVSVSVRADIDHDGDPVLRVLVTYRAKDDKLDPARVLSLIRHLRLALDQIGESRFPLVNFQTEVEAKEKQREAS